ncbi:MAG: helix-turn-helix transcriptional regulator [Porticoccaceae bacterium]
MKFLRATDVQGRMQALGISASALAGQLGVSRQTVSNWLNGRDLPRPDKLLRLSLALNLPFDQLLGTEQAPSAPVVAYRMSTNRKARNNHYEQAMAKGEALEALVPHLPFDSFVQPEQLKNPKADYAYVELVANSLREGLGLKDVDPIWFNHLIGRFKDLQSVIVPVLWGKQESHANALHIYLPQHSSTWVYLNLDSNAFDFMFWMAHELAHAYTSTLCGTDTGEDFADMLASALLFPEPCAKVVYKTLSGITGRQPLIEAIVSEALERHINVYTVFKQINAYAAHHGLPAIEVDQRGLHGTRHKIAAATKTIREIIFGDEKPSAREYIAKCEEAFDTPLFKAMSAHIRATEAPAGFVQHILDIPFADAQALHAELRV